MSNEARDIRIKETIATFEAITDELAHGYMINHPIARILDVAVSLTPIVMSENGENTRASDLRNTMYRLQNDLVMRVDQIRELADSIAGHVLESSDDDPEVRKRYIREAIAKHEKDRRDPEDTKDR